MKFKLLSLLLIALFTSAVSNAQKTEQTDNLLFLLRNPEHVTQALKTVKQLKEANAETTLHTGKVVIIVCGEAITAFAGKANNETVEEAGRLGVSLLGCGLSLNKFKLTKEDLMPGVQYVNNGFIKAFELQKAGYLSVEL